MPLPHTVILCLPYLYSVTLLFSRRGMGGGLSVEPTKLGVRGMGQAFPPMCSCLVLQVLDMKTGDLMAEADNPRYDLFPLHRSGYMEV